MSERRRVVIKVGKEVLGKPYISCAISIYNGDEVIGAVIGVETIEKQAIHDLAGNTDEISAQSQEIAGISRELAEKMIKTVADVRDTTRILDLVKGIAAQTNLLGLNAAIEAIAPPFRWGLCLLLMPWRLLKYRHYRPCLPYRPGM